MKNPYRIKHFNEQELIEFYHLLPPAFHDLVQVAGLEAAFELVRCYGGTSFPVGKRNNKLGRALHHALSEIVGETAADKISIAYAAQRKVWIPKCKGAVLECRNRLIRRQFDELTTKHNMPAYLAVSNLALEHDLVERQIWRIMKESDKVFESHHQMPLL